MSYEHVVCQTTAFQHVIGIVVLHEKITIEGIHKATAALRWESICQRRDKWWLRIFETTIT